MSVASQSMYFGLAIAATLVIFDNYQVGARAEMARVGLGGVVLIIWMYFTLAISKPNKKGDATKAKRLQEALPLAGNTGLTAEWYEEQNEILSRLYNTVMGLFVVGLLGGVVYFFPNDTWDAVGTYLQNTWTYARTTYTPFQLQFVFLYGILLVSYFGISFLYLTLDVFRPRWAEPYKSQNDYRLTLTDFCKAITLVSFNHGISGAVLYFMSFHWDVICPNSLGEELPGFIPFLVQLAACAPLSELWFYTFHRISHHFEWLFENVHYIHHSWKAPIALTAVYAHPLEHFVTNMPTGVLGPVLMGSHITVFYAWAVVSMASTCNGHSGWMIPFIASCQGHDYHHWCPKAALEANYGTMNLLDRYFQTDVQYFKSWQCKADNGYSDASFPVMKVLAMNGLLGENGALRSRAADDVEYEVEMDEVTA